MKLSVFVFLFAAALSMAQNNPFFAGGNEPASAAPVPGGSIWRSVAQKSSSIQKEMQNTIAGIITEVKSGRGSGSLLLMLGVSFIFGLLHAAGPGHRKGILISFFLGEGYAPLKGIAAGFLMAGVHALSAVVLVGGLYFLTTRPLSTTVNTTQNLLMAITWGIIFLMGLWLLFRGIRHRHRSNETGSRMGLGALVLTSAVPCPGASAIMIFAVAQKAFLPGVLSVAAMSAGMGVPLGATGVLSILFRRRMTSFLKHTEKGAKLEKTLHILSGTFMVLFALFMIAGIL